MIQLFVKIENKKIKIDLSNDDCNNRIIISERVKKKYIEIIQNIFSSTENKISIEYFINDKKYEKEIDINNITFFAKGYSDSKELIKKISSVFLDREHYEIIMGENNPFNKPIDIAKILDKNKNEIENLVEFINDIHVKEERRIKRTYKDIECGDIKILLYEDI